MMNQLKAASQATTPEHSTGELVKLVAEQVSVLVRDEVGVFTWQRSKR
jgi:hypothetical protein